MSFTQPDEHGRWGRYGGRYVPETLMAPLDELTAGYFAAREDAQFQSELDALLRDYSGRPTPLFRAARLTEHAGGAVIYLKREDLSHTGSHKINNALGQALLARRMGKRRVIAETGAGQQHRIRGADERHRPDGRADRRPVPGLRPEVWVGWGPAAPGLHQVPSPEAEVGAVVAVLTPSPGPNPEFQPHAGPRGR